MVSGVFQISGDDRKMKYVCKEIKKSDFFRHFVEEKFNHEPS